MPAGEKKRKGRRPGEPAGAAVEGTHATAPPQANVAGASLVLPCPLIVLETTTASEAGRPLSDLLRRIGYL